MLINSLQAAVIGIGTIICLICLTGVILPAQLLQAARAAWEYRAALFVAIMARLTIGVLLVLAAPYSRFPPVFGILGWLAIAAALFIPAAGRVRIGQLLDWWSRRSLAGIRLWSLAGLAFGCFLVYGAT
jgi:hypothetical protein